MVGEGRKGGEGWSVVDEETEANSWSGSWWLFEDVSRSVSEAMEEADVDGAGEDAPLGSRCFVGVLARCRTRMLWAMWLSENGRATFGAGSSGVEYSITVFRIAVVISSLEV